MTPACAESFTISDNVSFTWDEGRQCEAKPEEYWVTKDWQGTISIDPSKTTIPFVGKKGEESEEKYLADYFEGTHEYYRTYPFLNIFSKDIFHGESRLSLINYQGVLRKITPMAYQDKLKKNMINNRLSLAPGREGAIHNYQIGYFGRLCWDAPFWLQVVGEIAKRIAKQFSVEIKPQQIAHFCLYDINPLDRGLITTVKGMLDSWNLVSPFKIPYQYSDGIGYNDLPVGLFTSTYKISDLRSHQPPSPDEKDYQKKWEDWKKSDNGKWFKLWQTVPLVSREDTPGYITPYLGRGPKDKFEITNPNAEIEKVPHLARLYEASKEVQKILLPGGGGSSGFGSNNQVLIASSNPPLNEKKLLAQATGTIPCGCKVLYPTVEDGCGCLQKNNCLGEHSQIGYCGYHMWGGCICGYTDCNPDVPAGCQCNLPLCGDASPVPTPPPSCGLPPAQSVKSCQKEAIVDTNPNDTLCCSPIAINLQAYNSFNITDWYNECQARANEDPPRPCAPRTESVSRQIGINLSHPYLSEIWNQTAESKTKGLFNILRLDKIPKFRPLDAVSQINYRYQPGSAGPSTGKFYFPYLGGIQLAKQWLTQALTPYKK